MTHYCRSRVTQKCLEKNRFLWFMSKNMFPCKIDHTINVQNASFPYLFDQLSTIWIQYIFCNWGEFLLLLHFRVLASHCHLKCMVHFWVTPNFRPRNAQISTVTQKCWEFPGFVAPWCRCHKETHRCSSEDPVMLFIFIEYMKCTLWEEMMICVTWYFLRLGSWENPVM